IGPFLRVIFFPPRIESYGLPLEHGLSLQADRIVACFSALLNALRSRPDSVVSIAESAVLYPAKSPANGHRSFDSKTFMTYYDCWM
ncbi:MAG: hypothetical protein ACREPG_05575, partial [Candidatus Binatia bacterium]